MSEPFNSAHFSALNYFRLVLVRPQFAGNIGSIARLATNFDCQDVHVVEPVCTDFKTHPEAQTFARGIVRDRMSEFVIEDNLEAVLRPMQMAIGFTRRQGELRQSDVKLRDIFSLVHEKKLRCALVFGCEESGLSSREIECCTHICTLDTAEQMPSLNLSHAVGVVLARLYEEAIKTKYSQRNPSFPVSLTAEVAKVEQSQALLAHFEEVFSDLGLKNTATMLSRFRKVFFRAGLSAQEIRLFRAFLSKIQVGLERKSRGKRLS